MFIGGRAMSDEILKTIDSAKLESLGKNLESYLEIILSLAEKAERGKDLYFLGERYRTILKVSQGVIEKKVLENYRNRLLEVFLRK